MVLCMAVCLGTGLIAGCGTGEKNTHTGSAKGTTEKKTFVFGDTTFNPENEEPDVNHIMLMQDGPAFVTEWERLCLSIQIPWKFSHGWQKIMKI